MNWLLEAVLFGLAFGSVLAGCLMVARWQRRHNERLAVEEAEMLAKAWDDAEAAKQRLLLAAAKMTAAAAAEMNRQIASTQRLIGHLSAVKEKV